MARIAVNTRLLQKGKLEGIGWYTYETLRRITEAHPEHEFIFLFDRPFDPEFLFGQNVRGVYAGPPTRHILVFVPWFELVIPYLLRKYKADVFLSPDGHLSLLSSVPSIPVIHDLNFLHHPEQLPRMVSWYYNFFFPRFAQKANRIITVSEYTKQDIVSSYRIDADKIDVSLNGCNDRFAPLPESRTHEVRQVYSGGLPYFLFVGLIIPRKNLARMIRAYSIFREKSKNRVKFLIVGSKKWWDQNHEAAYQDCAFKEDIHFIGRLDAADLHQVMASALALTFVPTFEGFGIPVLEAMKCGVPVITSNVTSLPEVAGDACVLVDPLNTEEIAEACLRVSKDEVLRSNLIRKGLERSEIFSWDKTASALWKGIEKVIQETKKIRLPKEPAKQ